jgi:hypothetical protein
MMRFVKIAGGALRNSSVFRFEMRQECAEGLDYCARPSLAAASPAVVRYAIYNFDYGAVWAYGLVPVAILFLVPMIGFVAVVCAFARSEKAEMFTEVRGRPVRTPEFHDVRKAVAVPVTTPTILEVVEASMPCHAITLWASVQPISPVVLLCHSTSAKPRPPYDK